MFWERIDDRSRFISQLSPLHVQICHEFIRRCLTYNQTERPGVLMIAQDPYLIIKKSKSDKDVLMIAQDPRCIYYQNSFYVNTYTINIYHISA
jgi:hypothetical protein